MDPEQRPKEVSNVISHDGVMNSLSVDQRSLLHSIVLDPRADDWLVWDESPSGKLTTAGFRLWMSPRQGHGDLNWIWPPAISIKISAFLWRLFNNAFPMDLRVQSREIQLASRCRCCPGGSFESLDQIFIQSSLASSLWNFYAPIIDKSRVTSIFQFRWGWIGQRTPKSHFDHMVYIVVACGLWELWCDKRMHDERSSEQAFIRRVQHWCSSLSVLIKLSKPSSIYEITALKALRLPVLAIPHLKIRWVSWDSGEGLTLNVDGSVSSIRASGGGLIRDVHGAPKLLFSSPFNTGISNTVAEFNAVNLNYTLSEVRTVRTIIMKIIAVRTVNG